MPEKDIELVIHGNTKPLETSINNAMKKVGTFYKGFRSLGPTRDPFEAFRREKTKTGKVHLDPLDKKKGPMKKDEFLKIMRLFKLNLFWRWIKGTWNTLVKYVPILGAIESIFESVLSLVLTGLLLPYLPSIMKSVGDFVKWGMDLFNLFQKGLVVEGIEKIGEGIGKIVADLTSWFVSHLPDLVAAGIKLALGLIKGIGKGLWEGGLAWGHKMRAEKAIALGKGTEDLTISDILGFSKEARAADPLAQAVEGVASSVNVYIDGKELRGLVKQEISKDKKGFAQSRPSW